MKPRTALLVLVLTATGCKLLAKKDDADAAASDAAVVGATADTASAASAAPSATVAVKAATPVKKDAGAGGDAGASAGKALAIPTPTTDRIPRNRDKDGPCPTGFTEQPGVENHSSCARNCKTEADCHGHTCEDSMVGDGKVCSDVASKKTPAPVKCKSGELEEDGKCLKMCTENKDCPNKGKCESMMVPNPNGGTSTAMVCR